MKKLKSILLALIIFVVLHAVTLYILSDSRIFPCQIKPVVTNMETLEWKDNMCSGNYMYFTIGSVQRLTPGANLARIGLIFILPLLITGGVMHVLYLKNKRRGMAII